MIPFRARGDRGAMAIKEYSSITGTSLSDCLVSYPGCTLGGVLLFCREVDGVFYSLSWLGKRKFDLFDKIKRDFLHAVAVSILLSGLVTWTLTKCMEKKMDENFARMLHVVLNKSWKQQSTKQQLYGHLPPISKPIQEEPHMLDSAGEIKLNLLTMFPNELLPMDMLVV